MLRAGKGLSRRRKGIRLVFKPSAAPALPGSAARGNDLWIGIDGPDDIVLSLNGSSASIQPRPATVTLSGGPPPPALSAYGRVLAEVLAGESTMSVRGDEAEEAWRIVAPVLDAWAAERVPLDDYPAGSQGPAPAEARLEQEELAWAPR